jgi:DNA-binding response OmpR family regulator
LDFILPGETGLDIARKVRKTHQKARLPIFLITAKELDSTLIESQEVGITEIIAKPVGKIDLLSKIRRHVMAAAGDQSLAQNSDNSLPL